MKVFISWSGERSKALAEILRGWLPAVLQAVHPYYSPDDIAKGTRWSGEIAKELEASSVGLICLTADNLTAPWILFEAGALSKNLDRSRLCPLLFGVEPTDIEGPLVQFQGAKFGKEETSRVVRMMNAELGDQGLATNVLESVFEMWWPQLESRVAEALAKPLSSKQESRSERELLEEVVSLTRSMSRGLRSGVSMEALVDLEERFGLLVAAVQSENVDEAVKVAVAHLGRPIEYLCSRSGGRLSGHAFNRLTHYPKRPVDRDRLLEQLKKSDMEQGDT